jgi:hypothetical protein
MDARQHEFYSTEEFGRSLKIKAQSIRHSLCKNGAYLGIRPRKLPNGRLLWPAAEVDRVIFGEEAKK